MTFKEMLYFLVKQFFGEMEIDRFETIFNET